MRRNRSTAGRSDPDPAWQGDDSDLGRVLRDAAREMATPEGLTDATAAALAEACDAFDTEAGPS